MKPTFFKHFLFLVSVAVTSGVVVVHTDYAEGESHPSFHIQQRWTLGGDAGWGPLLVDAHSGRLYVPRTDRVMVLDTETGKAVGEITGFVDARNVALDDSGKYGYVSDITDGSIGLVRVFDRSTFATVASISVGRIPGAIVFDPLTKIVFAFSTRDRNVSVIDSKTNVVTATIPLPGKPHIAVSDGKGSIFAGLRGIGQMVRINTASRSVSAIWPIAPCVEFTGMAFDATHRQLLASCADRKLISVDADSGQITTIGEGTIGTGDLAFDARSHLLISSAYSGELSIFRQESTGRYTLEEQTPTLPRAGTMALDPSSGRLYLATAKFQQRPVAGKGMEEMESRLTPVPGSFVVLVLSP